MKNRILESLKTKYGHLGFDAKALDGVASFLENNITEESQIDTLVDQSKGMLEAFNGEADRRSSKATNDLSTLQSEYDAYKAKNPDANPNPNPNQNPNPDGKDSYSAEAVQKMINDAVNATEQKMNDKFKGIETQKTQDQIRKEALVDLKANPLYKNEVNATLMQDKFDNISGEFENKEAMLEAVKNQYEPLISKIGVNTPPPQPDGSGGSTEVEEAHKKFVNQQRKPRGQEELK